MPLPTTDRSSTPYKPNLIELCFPPAIEVVLFVTLNGDPLAEPIAVLPVITGNGAMPLTLTNARRAATPLFQAFSEAAFALSNHHNSLA